MTLRTTIPFLIVLILTLAITSGCICGPQYPPEFNRMVKENHARMVQYIKLREENKKAWRKKASKDKAHQTELERLDAKANQKNLEAWSGLLKVMEGKTNGK